MRLRCVPGSSKQISYIWESHKKVQSLERKEKKKFGNGNMAAHVAKALWKMSRIGCQLCSFGLLNTSACFSKSIPGFVSHQFQRKYIHSIFRCPKQMRSSFPKLEHAKQHIAHILTQPKARTVFFVPDF